MGVSTYKLQNVIWDKLCLIYEGMSEDKIFRLNILQYDY